MKIKWIIHLKRSEQCLPLCPHLWTVRSSERTQHTLDFQELLVSSRLSGGQGNKTNTPFPSATLMTCSAGLDTVSCLADCIQVSSLKLVSLPSRLWEPSFWFRDPKMLLLGSLNVEALDLGHWNRQIRLSEGLSLQLLIIFLLHVFILYVSGGQRTYSERWLSSTFEIDFENCQAW